jgi:hypothetical protein
MSFKKAEFYADFNTIEKVAIKFTEKFVNSNKFGLTQNSFFIKKMLWMIFYNFPKVLNSS